MVLNQTTQLDRIVLVGKKINKASVKHSRINTKIVITFNFKI